MSIDALADELLLEIAQSCVDLFHVADEFYGGVVFCRPPSHGLVWCKYWKLASLSAVNARMRRVTSPILFSHVFLEWQECKEIIQDEECERPRFDPAAEVLQLALNQRTEMAQHIRIIQAPEHGRALRWRIDEQCLSDRTTEILCRVIPSLPNLESVYSLPIRVAHGLVTTINSHSSLQEVDVLWSPRAQVCNALPGERRNFLARLRLRDLCVQGYDNEVLTEQDIAALREWIDMGMRIKNLQYFFSWDKSVTMRLLRLIPPSLLDRISIWEQDKHLDFDAFKHDLVDWLQNWPSSPTPEIRFQRVGKYSSLPPLCPDFTDNDNLEVKDYMIGASPTGCVPQESSFCTGSRAWTVVEASMDWDEEEVASTGDCTLAYHMPNVETLNIWASRLLFALERIEKLAHILGRLPYLRCLRIERAILSLPTFAEFSPSFQSMDFRSLDFEIRRQVTEDILRILRESAPSLQEVKFSELLLLDVLYDE